MERRDMIRGLAAFGAMAFMPEISARENRQTNQLHFVGLGQGGTNAVTYLQGKGIIGKYTCITGSYVSHLSPETKHIFYEAPRDFRLNGANYMKSIALTTEMKNLLAQNDKFIVLTGLGGAAGTGLISSVLEYLQIQHKNYMAFCSMPFYNEGRSKNSFALAKRSELKENRNIHFIDQNLLLEKFGKLTVREAFAKVNEQYYQLFMKYSNHFLEPDVN
jgi:cell division GTPase FtsZ